MNFRDVMYVEIIKQISMTFYLLEAVSMPSIQYFHCEIKKLQHLLYYHNEIKKCEQRIMEKMKIKNFDFTNVVNNVVTKDGFVKIGVIGKFTDEDLLLFPRGNVCSYFIILYIILLYVQKINKIIYS